MAVFDAPTRPLERPRTTAATSARPARPAWPGWRCESPGPAPPPPAHFSPASAAKTPPAAPARQGGRTGGDSPARGGGTGGGRLRAARVPACRSPRGAVRPARAEPCGRRARPAPTGSARAGGGDPEASGASRCARRGAGRRELRGTGPPGGRVPGGWVVVGGAASALGLSPTLQVVRLSAAGLCRGRVVRLSAEVFVGHSPGRRVSAWVGGGGVRAQDKHAMTKRASNQASL
jgi:hypothetical protein